MTLPSSRIGDKGQRYLVEAKGWPNKGWNEIGWAGSEDGAQSMANTISKSPSCTETRIVDRMTHPPSNEKDEVI